jgi:acyl-CoA thioesterase-1
MKRAALNVSVVGVLALTTAAAAGAIDDVCRVPDEYVHTPVRFEQVAAARHRNTPVRIVVMGTASSVGTGVSRPGAAYPARLEQSLVRRWGAGKVTVANASQAGRTARQMADRLAEVIRTHRPHLVVWQTGTVDAIRGVDLTDFAAAIERGIRITEAAQVDLLLVDSQYGSQTHVLQDLSPYVAYIDQVVRGHDVALFHRYDVMRHWVESGAMTLTDVPKPRQQQVADQVHDCLGQLLAEMIATAAE